MASPITTNHARSRIKVPRQDGASDTTAPSASASTPSTASRPPSPSSVASNADGTPGPEAGSLTSPSSPSEISAASSLEVTFTSSPSPVSISVQEVQTLSGEDGPDTGSASVEAAAVSEPQPENQSTPTPASPLPPSPSPEDPAPPTVETQITTADPVILFTTVTQTPSPEPDPTSSATLDAADTAVPAASSDPSSASTPSIIAPVVVPSTEPSTTPTVDAARSTPPTPQTQVPDTPTPVLPSIVAAPSPSSLDLPEPASPSTELSQTDTFVPIPQPSDFSPSPSTPPVGSVENPSGTSNTELAETSSAETVTFLNAETAPSFHSSTSLSATATDPTGIIGAASTSTHDSNHSSSTDASVTQSHGLPSGTVVAISAGTVSGVIALTFIAVFLVCCLKRRRKQAFIEDPNAPVLGKPRSPFSRSAGGDGFGSQLSALLGLPIAVASGVRAKLHTRGPSSTGLINKQTAADMGEAHGTYRTRRSQSEPAQQFEVFTRPRRLRGTTRAGFSATARQQQSPTRPQTAESPGPIQQYQMPWQSHSRTALPKTLRVVNAATTDNTPAPIPSTSSRISQEVSYFTLPFPAKATTPTSASASHRRSVSLNLITLDDPFQARPSSGSASSYTHSEATRYSSGLGYAPNFTRAQLCDVPPAAAAAQRHRRGSSAFDPRLHRVSQSLSDNRLPSRNSRDLDRSGQFPAEDRSVSGVYTRSPLIREASADRSTVESSVESLTRLASSNEVTPDITPITDPNTVSRNNSDASTNTDSRDKVWMASSAAETKHFSYDPFNHNSFQFDLALPEPAHKYDDHIASHSSPAAKSEGPSFGLGLGDSNCSPPATRHMSSQQPARSGQHRQTSAVSNDPFDLDRPEVLGYTPGAMKTRFDTASRNYGRGRSDSTASRGSVAAAAGRSKRRSSLQEWSYMEDKYTNELADRDPPNTAFPH